MSPHHLPHRLLAFGLLAALLAPVQADAEFFSYEDRSGTIHFVDDPGKIPKEYRQKTQVRKDKYDDLPDDERELMLERDRQEHAANRRSEALQQERQRKARTEQELRAALEQKRQEMTTPVIISGRQVFVPVKLSNGSVETEARLLLDTGAGTSVITPEVAARLNLDPSEYVSIKVVGGKVLRARKGYLGLQVGPVQRENQEVVIVRGGGMGDGLLGMNFLAGLQYTIDFEAQTINWLP